MKSNPHQVICEEIYVVISCMTVPFCMCTDNTYIVSKELCWSLRMSTFRFVDVSTCRRFGLSTFWFVDVSACRRFGLSTFWFVDVSVCRRFGLSTFRFVDVSVCRRFGCRRFGLSTFWLVTSVAYDDDQFQLSVYGNDPQLCYCPSIYWSSDLIPIRFYAEVSLECDAGSDHRTFLVLFTSFLIYLHVDVMSTLKHL